MPHRALLVGVNFYGGDENLQGGVHDVEAMRQYLSGHPKQFEITALTATAPPETPLPTTTSSNRNRQAPLEADASLWATKPNVIRVLQNIIRDAKPEEEILMYFSGHGARLPEDSPGSGGPIQALGHLALILFDQDPPGKSYLHGSTLAKGFRSMAHNGLNVTVILDCCYSGSVMRAGDDCTVRGLAYDPLLDAKKEIEWGESNPAYRGADVSTDHLYLDTSMYAILSACGAHQVAEEFKDPVTGLWVGAFSFNLLKALEEVRRLGSHMTYSSLFDHLCARFRAERPQQTPVRFGDGNFTLIQHVDEHATRSLSVFWSTTDRSGANNHLLLNAGRAHRVRKGDQYALYNPFLDGPIRAMLAEVSDVYDLTSEMIQLQEDQPYSVDDLTSDIAQIQREQPSMEQVQNGWRAQPLPTNRPEQKLSVRLGDGIEDFEEDHPWIHFHRDRSPCPFHISKSNDFYHILDADLNKIPTLPDIPIDENAITVLLNVLTHVAKYKYTESLENNQRSETFESTFSIAISATEINHNNTLRLEVTKLVDDDKLLYLSLFNLDAFWGITNMLPQMGEGWYREVGYKNGTEVVTIRMFLPEEVTGQNPKECKDVFKVFITTRQTAYPMMLLPPIDPRSFRGDLEEANELGRFLADLNLQHSHRGSEETEAWATRNITVITKAAD